MSDKIKHIRILVTTMVELETNLPVEEAIDEFVSDCHYSFPDTAHVRVRDTEWRETDPVSTIEFSNDGNSSILKPFKKKEDVRY